MTKGRGKLVIPVDSDIYPLEAVYGAAYSFLDKAYIRLKKGSDSEIMMIVKGKSSLKKGELDEMGNELMNELLNFSLKSQISKSNKKIREYIVGRALASALPEMGMGEKRKPSGARPMEGKPGPKPWNKDDLEKEFMKRPDSKAREADSCSFPEPGEKDPNSAFVKDPVWEKDPKGIAIPWEEKYKKRKNKKK